MGNYETLNELLVTLFRDVMDIEQKVIITPEFKDITNNDMHVIEAIGIGEPKNMSSIARELSVTAELLQSDAAPLGIPVMILHDFWPFVSYVRSTMADTNRTRLVSFRRFFRPYPLFKRALMAAKRSPRPTLNRTRGAFL